MKGVFFLVVAVAIGWYNLKVQPTYRSVTHQAFHYFARSAASGSNLLEKVSGRSTWYGPDLLSRQEEWLVEFTKEQQKSIIETVRSVSSRMKLSEVKREDFPWPKGIVEIFERAKTELLPGGLGFIVLRGTPAMSSTEQEFFFWGMGLYLGIPGAQDSDGHLLGHVRAVKGADPRTERQYKTTAHIRFHSDGADVVGLLCVQQGKSGGTSRIASTSTIFNELQDQLDDMELLRLLFEPVPLDTRGTGGINWASIRPLARDSKGLLRTFYHAEYFQSVYRHKSAPTPSKGLLKVIEEYERIANDSRVHLDMDFLVGDVQLISNHEIVHSRTGFENSPNKERHLLRLWLSLEEKLSLTDRFYKERERIRLICAFAWGKLRDKFA